MPRFPDYLPPNPTRSEITRAYNELREYLAANAALPGLGFGVQPVNIGQLFNVVRPILYSPPVADLFLAWIGASHRAYAWVRKSDGSIVDDYTTGPTVYSDLGSDSALSADLLHYAIQEAGTGIGQYATWNYRTGAWAIESTGITPGAAAIYQFLQIDPNGEPYIIHHDLAANGATVYALRKTGGIWSNNSIFTLPAGTYKSRVNSFCLDSLGKWHILYVAWDNTFGFCAHYANEDGVDEAVITGSDALGTSKNARESSLQLAISPAGDVWTAGQFAYPLNVAAVYRTGPSAWSAVHIADPINGTFMPVICGVDADGAAGLTYANNWQSFHEPIIRAAKLDASGILSDEEVYADGGTYSVGECSYTGLDLGGCLATDDSVVVTESDLGQNYAHLWEKPYARDAASNYGRILASNGNAFTHQTTSLMFAGVKGVRNRNQFAPA